MSDRDDEALIAHLVSRFLCWRLPENFAPDNGISFSPRGNVGTPLEYARNPVGTNLLDATQTTEMVRWMLEGLAAFPQARALADSGTAESFLALSDEQKREFFAQAVEDSTRRKRAEQERDALADRLSQTIRERDEAVKTLREIATAQGFGMNRQPWAVKLQRVARDALAAFTKENTDNAR